MAAISIVVRYRQFLTLTSCVNTFGSGDLAVNEVFDALVIDAIDVINSRSGVEVMVDNGCV